MGAWPGIIYPLRAGADGASSALTPAAGAGAPWPGSCAGGVPAGGAPAAMGLLQLGLL